jgi:signal transduction histidine kinase
MDTATASVEMSELAAALLQGVITAALGGLCWFLYRRYRKPYLAWWTAAWSLYVLRLGAIASFLLSHDWAWLYWHQVVTGWTALALLGAALVFSRGFRLRWRHLVLALFPPLWSYIAIYRIDDFAWAAGPAVGFLSLATLWTGWVFLSYHRQVGSSGAALLAAAFGLWGLHHLDYPFLRARGAWSPWGYYLDILFALAVGAGILLLVLDDLRRGLAALAALSADLQRRGHERPILDALLARPLTLPAVTGSALYLLEEGGGRFVGGTGVCDTWPGGGPAAPVPAAIADAIATGKPRLAANWPGPDGGAVSPHPYAAVLPVSGGSSAVTGALVIVGEARDPFAALDEDFLVALGRQVGAALENAALYERLELRTAELERLSMRMLAQHEDERRRLSRELHDETAQLFSAVKMELALLRDGGALPDASVRLERSLALIDAGIRSIRRVTHDLRPTLLDDLGLLPALRSLVAEFGERSGATVELVVPASLPRLGKDAELAVFRALQEALANIAKHAGARSVRVMLGTDGTGAVLLQVRDDGRGLPQEAEPRSFEPSGHMGLAGMRERIAALGGRVDLESRPGEGVTVWVHLPAAPAST